MKRIPENPTLDEIRDYFEKDRFATQAAGCRVVEGHKGYGVCEMELTEQHRNAMGNVMGGAIFTLADFALALACNIGEAPTVSIESDIKYHSLIKGSKLVATARADKSGKHIGFYTVEIVDDRGKHVATMTATCYR